MQYQVYVTLVLAYDTEAESLEAAEAIAFERARDLVHEINECDINVSALITDVDSYADEEE